MKGKIKFLLLALVLTFSMLLTVGCTIEAVDSIEWGAMPKTYFALDATNSTSDANFSIDVSITTTKSSQLMSISYNHSTKKFMQSIGGADATVTTDFVLDGFSVAKIGTFRASIVYKNKTSLAFYFTYTVVDMSNDDLLLQTETLNGETYYVIENASQFTGIALGFKLNATDSISPAVAMTSKYHLRNDIDFSLLDSATKLRYEAALYDSNSVTPNPTPFSGSLDGGKYTSDNVYTGYNYKILNYTPNTTNDEKQCGLFLDLGTGTEARPITIRNLDLVNCSIMNNNAGAAGIIARGRYKTDAFATNIDSYWLFENINVKNCKMITQKNSAFLIGIAAYAVHANFNKINIDSDCFSSAIGTVGGILGAVTYVADANMSKDIHFSNCRVSASLLSMNGTNMGALWGNPGSGLVARFNYSASKCIVDGKFYVCANPKQDPFNKSPIPYGSHFVLTNATDCSYSNAKYYVPEDDTFNTSNSVTAKCTTLGLNLEINETIPTISTKVSTDIYGQKFAFAAVPNTTKYSVSISFSLTQSTSAGTSTYYITEVLDASKLNSLETETIDNKTYYYSNLYWLKEVFVKNAYDYAGENETLQPNKGTYVLNHYSKTVDIASLTNFRVTITALNDSDNVIASALIEPNASTKSTAVMGNKSITINDFIKN